MSRTETSYSIGFKGQSVNQRDRLHHLHELSGLAKDLSCPLGKTIDTVSKRRRQSLG